MKTKNAFFFLFLLATVLSSCEEFIETDLSKKSLVVISPGDNITNPSFSQTFWWEELKGAEKYQIQIVKPNFSSIQLFVMDTSVSGDKLTLMLQPGTYQWRIRAKNSTSETAFITRNLTIDSTLDLSGQPMGLMLPVSDFHSNTLTNTFSWQTMPNAQSYVFQILIDGALFHTQPYTTTTASFTFSGEETYEWRVFAQNATSNSMNATRTITIDTTHPVIPLLAFPLTDTTSNTFFHLGWSHPETTISFRFQISTDSTFTFVSKDTTLSANSYDYYNPVVAQDYYWRVKAIDKALNHSAYLPFRRITKN